MRIAYVITRSDSIGGAHVHLLDLATAMRSAGHDVTVFAGGDGPFFDELSQRNIQYKSVPELVRPIRPGQDLKASRELRRALAPLRPDLVAVHSSKAGWIGRFVARSLKLPVVFTVHGWAFTDGVAHAAQMLYRAVERLAAPLADRIITVSHYDRRLAIEQRVAPEHKLITIHNGVHDVPPKLFSSPGQDPPKIIMVARFEAPKDHELLLRALGELQAIDWNLELVGDGPLRPKVEGLAATLGIRDRIHFSGACRDIPERLATAQVFVLTSNWEGFPLTVLEAMRAGLPVIASDVGGVSEAVKDGVTGFLVPRGELEALVDRLRVLLREPALRERMGRQGRNRYQVEFTFDRMFERTLSVYRELTSR